MKHTYIEVRDIGERVVCDCCNADYSNRSESGGILFGSHAICPACTPSLLKDIEAYGEQDGIKARCPEGMSFRDWVLQLRGGDNTIKIISVEDK